ncbi:MAG: hypothetical protein QM495_03675 [Lutibacter sp.]|uniref:hypothetical protein n=1 Tax=Lutibacter sp. TaxID=1925666 RepID=UPI00385B7090
MIHYLKRYQIDVVKYNTCVELATNSRIYAYSWYLDIVADNWDVLILDDYKAVMPLPWRSKYFIKYIYPPTWTQQLGVFSEKEISQQLISNFIKEIPKKFKKVTIQFNSDNDLSLLKATERVNYILPLNKSINSIEKSYKSNRKYSVNKAKKNNLIIKSCTFKSLASIGKLDYSYLDIPNSDYSKLKLIVDLIEKKNKGFVLGIYSKDNILLGGAVFLKDNKRISYLFSVTSFEGKKLQATSFLINEVFERFQNSLYIFDFEGSVIPGIASFFKSFGAEAERYFLYQKPFQLF